MIALVGVLGCGPGGPPDEHAPTAPEAAWWPNDARYREAAVRGFAEDLVAEGLATELRGTDCQEYPCIAHVAKLVPRERYPDVSTAMSLEDAEFVRRERAAGYLPGGTTSVLEVTDGWAVSHVVAGLASPLAPHEVDRLDARVQRMLAR